ncbi:hypothetical protein BWK69_00980 [Candidatus Parcubacteria bacterium A4]|nr:MAG: hypothetical protein BWK69_00980 [Candidatus Parcubacteria bacterium A4]
MTNLIILHGWQSSKEKWGKVKDLLEKEGMRVIIPDLPGFKKETELSKAWNLDDYVEWFNIFSKEYPPFFLLGHSFGGRMAIKFSEKYPNTISGLILVSAGGAEQRKNFKKSVLFFLASIFKHLSFLPGYSFLRKLFYKFIVRKTDYLAVKGFLKETFKNVIKEDLKPLLGKIKTETLIVWGDKDNYLSVQNGFLMKEKISNSELKIFQKMGHNLHTEIPEKLTEIIIKFIKKHS